MKPVKVEISRKTIIFTTAFIISLYLFWRLRNIILLFFVCFIFMEALNPTVTRLEKLKIPRIAAIIIIYTLLLTIIGFTFASIIPILIDQSGALIKTLPEMLRSIKFFGTSAIDLSSQLKILETLPAQIATATLSFFTNIFSALVVLFITFYLLLERRHFNKYSSQVFGIKGKIKVMKIIDTLELRLGSWVNAEMVLMTVIGLLSYFGYLALGLSYTVPLAILAALMEIVPNIGPIITGAVSALVGLTISPLTALLTIIWGIVIHQLENNFITPKIMKETIGLNPIVTILVIASGAQLAGIAGAILAVPVYLTIETVVKVLLTKE